MTRRSRRIRNGKSINFWKKRAKKNGDWKIVLYYEKLQKDHREKRESASVK